MAGALQVQLAGDAWYFGELYKKPTIGGFYPSGEAGGYSGRLPSGVRSSHPAVFGDGGGESSFDFSDLEKTAAEIQRKRIEKEDRNGRTRRKYFR